MSTQVKSSMSGGQPYSAADQQTYATIAALLNDQASSCERTAAAWGNAQLTLSSQRSRLAWCAAQQGTGIVVAADGSCSAAVASASLGASLGATSLTTTSHVVLDYGTLIEHCAAQATAFTALATTCAALADRVARAFSLYDNADRTARGVVNNLVRISFECSPLAMLGTVAIFALGGLAYSVASGEGLNMFHALNATSWAQEGLMAGIGSLAVGGSSLLSFLAGSQVSEGASIVARESSVIKNMMQGDTLTVTEVDCETALVGEASGVSEALADLRRLGTARLSGGGVDYGTIAISKYENDDGTVSWLVTIPGTDGNWDSPFGWEQNLELMSDDASIRTQADSYRMVIEAMRMAGIDSHDSVALIGHSQGGIVAAAIASDCGDEFTIDHIVTAGSPIANHPIDESTWVTAIEMDDELVAALDGAVNPTSETWLTVRGTLVDGSSELASGAEVMTNPQSYEITHWLEYHMAAYDDALSLGSPALTTHDEHFAAVVSGTYAGTTYYQGRMTHGGGSLTEKQVTDEATEDGAHIS